MKYFPNNTYFLITQNYKIIKILLTTRNMQKYFWTKLGGTIVRVRIRHGIVEIVVKRTNMRAVVPITPT
jgi:hypothetical protein